MWQKLPIILKQPVNQKTGYRTRSATVSSDGMRFERVRDYEIGDSPRLVSVRDLIKFDEEIVVEHCPDRNAIVAFMIDVSASESTGSERSKLSASLELARGLGGAFISKGHRLILIAFTTDIEFESNIVSGVQKLGRVLDEVVDMVPRGKGTNPKIPLDRVLELSSRAVYPADVTCIISDFLFEPPCIQELGLVSACTDTMAFIVRDKIEYVMPPLAGGMMVRDSETGETFFAADINQVDRIAQLEGLGIDTCLIETHQSEEEYFYLIKDFFTLRQEKGGKA